MEPRYGEKVVDETRDYAAAGVCLLQCTQEEMMSQWPCLPLSLPDKCGTHT